MNILILGGTKQARVLAQKLAKNHHITYSIAGITDEAKLPNSCKIISGGFGGATGLTKFLCKESISHCIDATHPFAQNITQNAIIACANANIPIMQLSRRPWQARPNDLWKIFNNSCSLISALPDNATILLTIGSQKITPYLSLKQPIIARMIAPPLNQQNQFSEPSQMPNSFKILLARPPFNLADEIHLMQQHKITHLICKNSGGEALDNKLLAARQLGVTTFMLAQPPNNHINRYHQLADLIKAINT